MSLKSNVFRTAAAVALALLVGACESDSPTAPTQGPAPPAATNNGATANFNLSVTATPDSFDLDELAETGDSRSTITVVARRLDNGQPVAVGSTAILSTTVGTLTDGTGTATGTSIPITFESGGRAIAFLDLPIQETVATVTARLQNTSRSATVRVLEADETPLFIQSVSPTSGPPSGGTSLTIVGTGFDPPVRVSVGGTAAPVLSQTESRITVSTPAITLPVGETSTVAVTVEVNVNDPTGTQTSDTLGNAFTYARAGQIEQPRIISITPTVGPNEGGTLVDIRGEGFADEVQVFFGTSALIEASVISLTESLIRAETPSATGPNSINQNSVVDIRVTNLASGASDTLVGAFQYGGGNSDSLFISAAGPTQGVYLGGTVVSIFGQGFDEPVAVEFGGVGQQEISVTGTEIVARSVPVQVTACTPPSGPFQVVNIETAEVATSGIVFTYEVIDPLIAGLSPSSATIDVDTRDIITPVSGETIISGNGFDRNDFLPRVSFGAGTDAVAASIVEVLSLDTVNYDPSFEIITSMRITIPPFFGAFSTENCTTAGGETGERLLPTRVDVMIENLTTGCTDVLVNGFTYEPSDTSCQETSDDTGTTTLESDFTVTRDPGNPNIVTFVHIASATAENWDWSFIPDAGVIAVLDGGSNQPFITVELADNNYTVTLVVDAAGQASGQTQKQITVPCVNTACTLQ